MFNKIGIHLLGTLITRGGFFLSFLISLQYYSSLEIAALGLVLLISNSIASTVSLALGMEHRNYIVIERSVNYLNISVFLLILFASVLCLGGVYFFIETIQIVNFNNYISNIILLGLLMYIQQVVYAFDLIKINAVINMFFGLFWLLLMFLFFPENINNFFYFYNIVLLLHVVFLFFLLCFSVKIVGKKEVSWKFIVDYLLYALLGLPVFMLSQLMVERYTNSTVLATIVVLVQVTNMVGFFNGQIITVLYNKLIKIVNYVELKRIIYYFRVGNIILIFLLSISYFFKNEIELYLNQSWFVMYVSICLFCLTSYYWVYNEFLLSKNNSRIVKMNNLIFGCVFLLLLFLLYGILGVSSVYAYVFSLYFSRFLVIYMVEKSVRGYFYESVNDQGCKLQRR